MSGRTLWPGLAALMGAALLAGCYYDPATGLSYAYPPPPAYGYPQPPAAYGAPGPGYGAPPAEGGYGAPPAEGGYGAPPPGYAAPPAGYGAAPGGYGGAAAPGYTPPAAGAGITRAEFVQRAAAQAEAHNRDPQLAAARAGAIFDEIDVNHAGVVTRAQIRAWRAAHRPSGNPGPNPGEPGEPPQY